MNLTHSAVGIASYMNQDTY